MRSLVQKLGHFLIWNMIIGKVPAVAYLVSLHCTGWDGGGSRGGDQTWTYVCSLYLTQKVVSNVTFDWAWNLTIGYTVQQVADVRLRVEIELIFCFWAVASEIQGNYLKCPTWAWNLAIIGKMFQKFHIHSLTTPGQKLSLFLLYAWSAGSNIRQIFKIAIFMHETWLWAKCARSCIYTHYHRGLKLRWFQLKMRYRFSKLPHLGKCGICGLYSGTPTITHPCPSWDHY